MREREDVFFPRAALQSSPETGEKRKNRKRTEKNILLRKESQRMYSYAVSIPDTMVLRPDWRPALENAKIKRIELGGRGDVTPEEVRNQLDLLLNLRRSCGLEIASIHIPFFPFEKWTLSSTDEAKRKEGVRKILEFTEKYRALEAKNYTLHGSGEPLQDVERGDILRSLRRSLEDLLPYFEKIGGSLNLELLPRTCIGHSAEELEEAVGGFPEKVMGICLDVNHLCGAPEKVPSLISRLGPRIRAFHISDYDGVDECHWYPGLGVLDWRAIMKEIRALDHKTVLIFETSSFVRPPDWVGRTSDASILFRNAANNAFFLENADEIVRKQEEFRP